MRLGPAVTNTIRNAVAIVAISRWEGELDLKKLRLRLQGSELA
jgi:PIN domain nuclease of toxin-antitoxin system